MNPPFIDIHTHLCSEEKDILKVCTNLLGQGKPLPVGRFVAGIHPWDVEKVSLDVLKFFDNPPAGLVGIGETGLDFSLPDVDKALQMEYLERQLSLAEHLGFPIVLHCVKAYNELQTVLKKYKLKAVVFHGFTGSSELAGQLTGQGYYLSFGGRTQKSPKATESLKQIPLDKFFLETDDDPDVDIRRLYEEVAALRSIPVDELRKIVFDNYKKVFNG